MSALEPLIILGAPRCGTNMLRDSLLMHKPYVSWPCDEINYIWRYGNSSYPTDELPVSALTPKIISYIHRQFKTAYTKASCQDTDSPADSPRILVEKTCANTLRTNFVRKVFPNAKYLIIKRDPYDAIVSTRSQYMASLRPLYLLKKARFVPISDLPYYSLKYFRSRFSRLFALDRSLPSWGPLFDNYQALRASSSLLEFCAHQHRRCVDGIQRFVRTTHPSLFAVITYEDFVSDPVSNLSSAIDHLGLPPFGSISPSLKTFIHQDSIGKAHQILTLKQKRTIANILSASST